MTSILAEVNSERLTSVVTSGFVICLSLLIVALYRNLKLKAENNRLKAANSQAC